MKVTITKKIGLLLLIPALCALLVLVYGYALFSTGRSDKRLIGIARHQKMLGWQLSGYIASSDTAQRDEGFQSSLPVLTEMLDRSLHVLEHGGELALETYPQPPPELSGEIDELVALWKRLKPALLSISGGDDRKADDAYRYLRGNIHRLIAVQDRIVGAYESRLQATRRNLLYGLSLLAAVSLVFLPVAVLVIDSYVRGRRHAEEGLRKIAGGFSGVSGDSLPRAFVKHLAWTLNVDYALLGELPEKESDYIMVRGVYSRGKVSGDFEYHLESRPYQKVMESRDGYYSNEICKRFPDDKVLMDIGADGFMGMPLIGSSGDTIGLMAVADSGPLEDIDNVRSIFELFAVRASGEMERERAREALKKETSYKELLQVVAMAANETSSIEKSMQIAIDQICVHTGWPVGHAYILSEDSDGLLIPSKVWHIEWPGRFDEFRLATESTTFMPGLGLPGRVLESGRPAWITDITKDSNFLRAELVKDMPLRGSFAFPVMVGAKVVAVLEFYSTVARKPDESLLNVMAHIGTQLGRVVERKHSERRLRHLVNHDDLTHLPNRTLFLDRLVQALARARWRKRLLAVLFLDLDRFKVINDTLGHNTGDRLLKAVAGRLSGCLREGDTVARLGGDEFAILLVDLAEEHDIAKVAQKVLDVFEKPFVVDQREIFITTSIGISTHPDDGDDPQSLLKFADIAMYRAKEQGKNNYSLYSPVMNARALERLVLESSLRHALEDEALLLHYQPKVDLCTGKVTGMEALLRWRHPEIGLVSPGEFIPLLEETGMILSVGEWVIRAACIRNKVWQEMGLPKLRTAVNMSARQFKQAGLVKMITRILDEIGLEPDYLVLEITESILVDHVEETIAILHEFNGMGIQVAIDDFGTGYSSLSYLKRLPIHSLKIDRSFIKDVTINPDDAAIVRATIAMAHSLKLKVVAEGVETRSQLAFLLNNGCDEVQGFYFCKPLTEKEFTCLLERGERLDLSEVFEEKKAQVLLIVDDEECVRSSIRRLLKDDGYCILTAANPYEAFESLACHDVDVVLSDQQMPRMNGTEFLSRIKKLYPDIVSILLTGHSDHESTKDAINKGGVYRYINKPYDNGDLCETVREAFKMAEANKGVAVLHQIAKNQA